MVFLTLEDETGPLNIIVWSSLFERERRIVLGARLMRVTGEVQREGESSISSPGDSKTERP